MTTKAFHFLQNFVSPYNSSNHNTCFSIIFLSVLSFILINPNKVAGQDFTFSNTSSTACSDDISGSAGGGYVNFRTIAVSGVANPLSCAGTVLKQINIKMGNPSCKGNLSTYKARLIAPNGGPTIQLFGNVAAGAPGFTESSASMWMDIKLRDDIALERVSDYTTAVEGGYYPYSIGYYRTTVVDAFATANGFDPNGTWTLQIAENTTSEVSFERIDLIFGSKVDIVNITTCSGDNNFCSGSTCMGTASIIRVNNSSYSQNDPRYPGNTVGTCSWNGANNNSAWLHFYASGTTAKITLSGMEGGGSSDQQPIVLVAPADCGTSPSVIPTGGCPKDQTRNNLDYISPNGGTSSGNVYVNGITANCDFNLSGLTPGQKYYLYVDGNGGISSYMYIEMASGAQKCNIAGTVELATAANNGIALTKATCDDGEWTYYYDPVNSTKLLFGIQWNIGSTACGGIAANNQTVKDNTTVRLYVEPNSYGETNLSPSHRTATYTMKRWFSIEKNTATNLTNPVNIRYFYDPAEKSDIQTQASTFATTYSVNTEPFKWFKVDGGYTLGTTPSVVVSPDTLSGAGLTYMTDVNTAGNLIDGVLYAQFNGLTSFSSGTGAAGASGGGPFPITWVSFHAEIQNEENVLKWLTTQEINNEYFEVQKSRDGQDFSSIGMIPALGNSSNYHNYFFIDKMPLNGQNFYRLKQVDTDGKFSFSEIKMLKNASEQIIISPNPAHDYVEIQAFGPITSIELWDTNGKICKKLYNTNYLPLDDLAQGIYFIRINCENRVTVEKIVKQ